MPVSDGTARAIDEEFERSVVPTLFEYIRIPNQSPAFDRDWRAAGHMDRAVELLTGWAREHLPPDATLEVVRLDERTPVVFVEFPATGGHAGDVVLFYGHLDKQPAMTGWREGLGPWTPVREGDKLYGRGGADDGYSIFASLLALAALRKDGLPHARAVVLIEACEESGSYDLPAYVEHLAPRIGEPSLVVCLDSGCATYDELWVTTSLRGMLAGTLEVSLLSEGVHSGDGTGVIAASERVVRLLLDRLEDARTGTILLPQLTPPIPASRVRQAERTGQALRDVLWQKFPLRPGVEPVTSDPTELILNRTWRPGLAVTGADGWPPIANAGSVMRPFTKLMLSMRLPPNADPTAAERALKETLEKDPPYGATVSFTSMGAAAGWDAPELSPWLERALDAASRRRFGKPVLTMGEGGTIPFMAMLGQKFPKAEFCVTGVLGPGSNAHGPNEFLDIRTAKRLTLCVADIVAEHARRAPANQSLVPSERAPAIESGTPPSEP
jgi:acetylornithine deacetylase/succinyl-diaminopimelate desuccinylase-like protein